MRKIIDWDLATAKYCKYMDLDPDEVISYSDGALRHCTTSRFNIVKMALMTKYQEELAYQAAIEEATKKAEPKEYPPSERGYL